MAPTLPAVLRRAFHSPVAAPSFMINALKHALAACPGAKSVQVSAQLFEAMIDADLIEHNRSLGYEAFVKGTTVRILLAGDELATSHPFMIEG